MSVLTSAGGLISLLHEPSPELRLRALSSLCDHADLFWSELADHVSVLERLAEESGAVDGQRALASLVASRVFFHLGELGDALAYALGAQATGDARGASVFSGDDEYGRAMVAQAVDEYVAGRVGASSGGSVDPRLEKVVEDMFAACFARGEFRHAVGIAIESRRLDMVAEAVRVAGPGARDVLSYTVDCAKGVVTDVTFRREIYAEIAKLYEASEVADPENIVDAHCYLGNHDRVAAELVRLIADESPEDDHLLAYQIAFNLVDTETRAAQAGVLAALPVPETKSAPAPAAGEGGEGAGEGAASSSSSSAAAAADASGPATPRDERLDRLRTILAGELSIALYLEYLYQHNRADLLLLRTLKAKAESRSTVLHGATVTCNALMHCGTTVDAFLRDNLDWLGKATHWAKFSATASLGVVHKGHLKESINLLRPYLPSSVTGGAQGGNAGQNSPYSEGGALLAMGLIHCGHGAEIVPRLMTALGMAAGEEALQHGACLGLAVAAMATRDTAVYEAVKEVLYADGAVSGMAAGIAMGMVMLGTGDEEAAEEMLGYARETQHEKIVRGLGLGLAFLSFGREASADPLLDQMVADKDPVIRYGGMYAIGMAFAGSSNNSAIERLLHVAVSDVSDDVRRAAVTCLGFVMYKEPHAVPRMVALLAESYNPHVRYGAAMALGISSAGTGHPAACDLLLRLASKDTTDFVRQGAHIALSMILVQASPGPPGKQDPNPDANAATAGKGASSALSKSKTDAASSSSTTTSSSSSSSSAANGAGGNKNDRNPAQANHAARHRAELLRVVGDKHEPLLAKVGAMLGAGIVDLGGRNCTLSLCRTSRRANVVGMALFMQHWYWFPMANFLALSAEPTALIALDSSLRMPKMTFECHIGAVGAARGDFALPDKMEEKGKKKVEKVEKAVLSTAGKARDRKKEKEKEKTSMDIDGEKTKPAGGSGDGDGDGEGDAKGKKPQGGEEPEAGEAASSKDQRKKLSPIETLENPARVVPMQQEKIVFPGSARYTPVSSRSRAGIVIVRDADPSAPVDLVESSAPKGHGNQEPEEPEPEPPAAFDWADDE